VAPSRGNRKRGEVRREYALFTDSGVVNLAPTAEDLTRVRDISYIQGVRKA
jgi:hypothetical protein